MDQERAIRILKEFNEWRRDNKTPSNQTQPSPSDIGKALDYVVKSLDNSSVLEHIDISLNPILKADGFDNAILGIDEQNRIIYSVRRCLEILEKDMSREEALGFFTFNVSSAYVGDLTPIWCWDVY